MCLYVICLHLSMHVEGENQSSATNKFLAEDHPVASIIHSAEKTFTLGYIFLLYGWFSGSPNCDSHGAVLEILLPSLKASPWDTIVEYMAGSLDLRIVVLFERFWRYFSPAWRHLPGIDFLNIWLFVMISKLWFFGAVV